jgi:hypothetical protein
MSTTWRNYIRSLLLLSNVICYNRLDLVHATATWLTKAADIHWEYVTRVASPRLQWLRERASMLRLHVHCLSCLYYAVYVSNFMFFAPRIVLQLCNINQRNLLFSNECFNTIFGIFYMFRNSWVHYQEDSLYTQCLCGFVCFSPDCLHRRGCW